MPRPDDVLGQPLAGPDGLRRRVHFVDEIGEADEVPGGVVEGDVEVPGGHDRADGLVDGLVEVVQVRGLVGGLGDPVDGVLEALGLGPLGRVPDDGEDLGLPRQDERRQRDLGLERGAVLAGVEPEEPLRLAPGRGGDELLGLLLRIPAVGLAGGRELPGGVADDVLFRRAAEDLQGAGVAAGEPLRVHQEDGVVRQLEDHPVVLLVLLELPDLLFAQGEGAAGLLAGGDVLDHGQEVLELSPASRTAVTVAAPQTDSPSLRT